MSSPLEKFILENREKFETDKPDPQVWEKINKRMNPDVEKSTSIRSMPAKRWMSIAATLLLVAVTGVLYYTLHTVKTSPAVVETTSKHPDTSNNLPNVKPFTDSSAHIAKVIPDNQQNKVQNVQTSDASGTPDNKSEIGDNKEMYYYAKLIELKHEELRSLVKDEPLLYKQFSGDVQRLDSVYLSLKTQLPTNSNREQVIEAMISNLQLQIGLLNKQLEIIKKIKHFKKTIYEKAYKSV